MKLNLVKTTYADLNSTARCVLALRNKPFFFVRMQDTLYMNKNIKGIRKITAAVETMWKYDDVATDEIMAETDAAYNAIVQAAGEEAAGQAWEAWLEMSEESRVARATSKALEWITTVYEKMDVAAWEEMHAAGYSSTFVDDGLLRAFSKLHNDNPDRPGYRDCSGNSREAAFVYGFQLGKAAAARHEENSADA